LTAQEHYEYQVLAGQMLKEALQEAVDSGVTDKDTLESVVNETRAQARDEYLEQLYGRNRKPDKVK
jgi:signal transduction protein with GAF and PtsI domain